jgi:uncharacterized protein (TIGR03000 family)
MTMFGRSRSLLSVAVVAAVGFIGSSSPAAAQYYYQRFYRPAPTGLFQFQSSIDNPMTYGAYTEGPGGFYQSIASPSAPDEQVAYIHIRVSPPHAEISFQGSKTMQVGSSRMFVSPPLEQGQSYNYEIRVSWTENGRVVTQDRKIPVRAGDRLSIVFRAQPTTGTSTMRSTVQQ